MSNEIPTYSLGETTIIGKPSLLLYFNIYLAKTSVFLFVNSLPLSIASWIIVGSIIWRGKFKKHILSNGFDYDLFLIMVKKKGSQTRIKILATLTYPKNRKQIAEDLGMDWKAIDRHVSILLKHQLINEMTNVGNATFYIRNDRGHKLLKTLSSNENQ